MRGDRAGKGQETGGGVPYRDTRTRSPVPAHLVGLCRLAVVKSVACFPGRFGVGLAFRRSYLRDGSGVTVPFLDIRI